MEVSIRIVEPYTIEFEEQRNRTLEKYRTHISSDLRRLGVLCDVHYTLPNTIFIKTTEPIEKRTICDHIKASMYKLGVNVECSGNPNILGNKNMSDEMTDECVAFMKAVTEMMPEKCGFRPATAKTIEIDKTKIEVPEEEIKRLAGELHQLSFEEKVTKVEEGPWVRNLSTGFIKAMFPWMREGTAEFDRARKSYAQKVATGMVTKFAMAVK